MLSSNACDSRGDFLAANSLGQAFFAPARGVVAAGPHRGYGGAMPINLAVVPGRSRAPGFSVD